MAEPVPQKLRDLVENSLAPGVRVDRAGKSSDRPAWWFNLKWRGQDFDLWVRDFWLQEKSSDLISSLAWIAAPAPEATLSGQWFWIRFKTEDQEGGSVRYSFALIQNLDSEGSTAVVQITATARQILNNIAGSTGRTALAFEMSIAIVAVKDHLHELISGGEIVVDGNTVNSLTTRVRPSDSAIRLYVGTKVYAAYLSSTSEVALIFTRRDLDYLGVAEEDFRRAISLVGGQDWDVDNLTIRPRKQFLQRFESDSDTAGSGVDGGAAAAGPTAGSRTVFVCHAEADKPVATVLKRFFGQADRTVEVFQASHPASLPGGYEWWPGIRDALLRASVVLTLVSPRSKDRPWLHFESGGAYFKGKRVIPLAVPPERKSLPPPLGVLQARDLAAKEDVAAIVKEVGQVLKVTFVGSPEDLWIALRDASARLSESSAGLSNGTREDAPPWERQLRSLAARGGTVQVHPIVPPAFAGDVFEIGPIDDMTIGLLKQDSRHRIDIPPNRVINIRKAGDGHVLDLHGRVQWTDAEDSWQYMPEDIDPKDPIGLGRVVDPRSQEITALEKKLNAAGWKTGFAHEIKARSRLTRSYQLVYASDGRYLRTPDRVAPSVMVKRRDGS